MKIQISYLPEDATRALWVRTYIQKLFPKAKVKETEAQLPRRIVYITVRENRQ